MAKQLTAQYYILVDGKNTTTKKLGNRKAAGAAFDRACKRNPLSMVALMSKHPRHGVTQLRLQNRRKAL